jgi:protein dithiol oxidoreductase (disulfide-forming)
MSPRHIAARWLGAVALALAAAGALGQANVRSEVVRLDPPRPVATGERIEVIEFFYYGCPICYELEPHMTRWLATQAPGYVALRRIPALSSDGWDAFARLYFTLQAMDEVSRLHWPIYDNFHFDGKPLNEEKTMLEWVAKNGVDPKRFAEIYHSPAIDAKLAEVREMMKTYDVHGVPSIVVDGKYMSSARLAGGTRQLMQVVDELVRQAKSERPK